ncbi:hypothetical protein M513_12167 [Trichuris suis]|uniref:Uncharacterized protein n=1 Tax=Trichuris suis TaxID=68888 RepID=A0A085LPT1_9BILA|nr:hypothetical protein M513_12167 [Trichuris suis]
MDYDPIMERSIKVTRSITDAMQPLYVLFKELKCQQKQLPIPMFFKRTEREYVSAVGDSQPSTSSGTDNACKNQFTLTEILNACWQLLCHSVVPNFTQHDIPNPRATNV